ncbi:hypothetical protein X989_5844 [Burkholderia pseudomallei MSHR4378]|nr:hypothetical protein X989_5844 [Burkholderia pseudomallei MSHR4378]KGX94593.1 hypothetical protein X997_5792 [Burkholderia pseudomallei A79C]
MTFTGAHPLIRSKSACTPDGIFSVIDSHGDFRGLFHTHS